MIRDGGKLAIAGAVVAFVLIGCSIPRQGELPEIAAAGNWSHPVAADVGVIANSWWEEYQIPQLTRIVRTVLETNSHLGVFAERVELARAEAGMDVAGSRPAVNVDTGLRAGQRRDLVSGFQTFTLLPWSGSGTASWELDWLGKWRERKSAARETVKASRSDLDAARLLFAAEVVTSWFQLQEFQHEAEITRRSRDRQAEILAVHRDRERVGLVEAAVIERQQAEINDLQRRIAAAEMRRQIAARKLDRLQGRSAEPGEYPLSPLTPDQPAPDIPAVLPAAALRRRPDLLAAEGRLRSAWSVARVARLDLYPSLNLRLGGVTMTGSLSDPFRAWMTEIGPSLQIPLWDAERRAASRVTSARAKLVAAEYRDAALHAVEEIEAALITHHRTREQRDHARAAARRAEAVVARTRDRRQAGLVSDIELLEDQRRALDARLTAIRLQARYQATFATIHRVLGVTP